jgi:hypothetical protein
VGRDVLAVTVLLGQVAGLLRQLVCVTGWLVLLATTATLLFQPHLTAGHLIAPGAGMLAVFQGLIPRASRRHRAVDESLRDDP